MFSPLSRPASSLPYTFNISPKKIPGTDLDTGGISEMLLCCMPKCYEQGEIVSSVFSQAPLCLFF